MKKAILISCYDWYDKRLKYVERVLLENGFTVDYYTSNFNHMTKKYIVDECNPAFNYVKVPEYKSNLSIKRLYSLKLFSNNIKKIVSIESPDLVYCLIPPNSLSKDLIKLKRRDKFQIIFDVIDLWPESMPISKFKNNLFFKFWRNLRDGYLDEADYIITECNLYQNVLVKSYKKESMKTMYICKEDQDTVKLKITDDAVITLCYLGSINNIIDFDLIGMVIKNISKIKPVVLKIIGTGEQKDVLVNIAKSFGAEVIDYGVMYDSSKKQEIFNSCDYGLNIYKDSTNIGLTSKSIDYFEAGLPIINNIKFDTSELVTKYNCGINLNEIDNFYEYYKQNMLQRKMCRVLFNEQFSTNIIYKTADDIFKELKES